MNLTAFNDWLSSTGFSQAIQTTSWSIPVIQTIHILALSLLVTAALILALRISGAGLRAEPLPQVAARFGRLIWWLLALLLVSGALLIIAEPHRTITNPVFYAKMIMLAAVSVLTLGLSAAARRNPAGPSALLRVAAAASMLLWVGIIFAGRFIAYYESY